MDPLARAQALLAHHARTAALLIMPLAAALTASAAPVLPASNFQCQAYAERACSGGASQLPATPGQVQGVKQWLDGQVLADTGEHQVGWVSFSTSGTLNEAMAAGTSIPIHYEFTVLGYSGSLASDWFAHFSILRNGNVIGTTSAGGPVGGFQTGAVTLTLKSALNAGDNIEVETTIGGATEDGYILVEVPQNSIDWNASVPEPASIGTAAAGLALAAILRRNR